MPPVAAPSPTAAAPGAAAHPEDVAAFLARWQGAGGSERANYQLFIADLCDLLAVPKPQPAREDTRDNAYVFERRVTFAHGDGSTSTGFIDCYQRGHFVLEAKKVRSGLPAGGATRGFDDAMLRARAQAEGYARALPASEGRPPFVVVVDVGHVIELYAEFTRSGATYVPFPDPRSHRIRLADLAQPAVRERLRLLWTDPLALDPSRTSARVTREVAAQLATLARSLEASGHDAQVAAAFLTRCLFSMFAEDVGLLPRDDDGRGGFVSLLERHRDDPPRLQRMLAALWADMDRGGFSAALTQDVLRFNGKLFKGAGTDGYVLPLTREQVDGLLAAARANWREVEPAIFGTLLERALDPAERHALGAHYTPRAYVERLVLPTVVEPLRADWADAQAAALLLATEANALSGKKRDDRMAEARAEIRRFHHRLCTTRVLDPACGSGNFLYVTLEHLKRLEGEVLDQLEALGDSQGRLGLEGETVTLQQLRGIELNARAAALAELVLWIGWLQWHIRTLGHANVAEPVIHDYRNIECRDAVLAWDGQEPMTDADGQLVTRWDGTTFKPHPVTGEPVPDERAVVPQWRYLNPRAAAWPPAEFIVGNPPFIGNKRMRDALGDGYVQALRGAWPAVPESADFVMYWWEHAAELTRSGAVRQFGFITTNSLRQTFNRRVIQRHLDGTPHLRLKLAIPDHPWVDSSTDAAVRIAMTVATRRDDEGQLWTVISEVPVAAGESQVSFAVKAGEVQSDLTVGAKVSSAVPLASNARLCWQGCKLVGAGFQLEPDAASDWRRTDASSGSLLKSYWAGSDLTKRRSERFVVDTFGLSVDQLRDGFPVAYQWLRDRVLPEREQNRDATFRTRWWLFGRPRPDLRASCSDLHRYIVTSEVSKHRFFTWLKWPENLIDGSVIAIASEAGLHLGILSASAHTEWAHAAGGRMGVGNDPRYQNGPCFDPFPFPSDDTGLTPTLTDRIRTLAEQLDAHRKARQAAHADLTLTGMYNVLAKLRAGEPLTPKERTVHDHGLVSVLRSLHDDLDAAVLVAYGWDDLAAPLADHTPAGAAARAAAVETLLERLVALNARRAAEEAAGHVRWLRPDFQDPARCSAQAAIDLPAAAAPADSHAAASDDADAPTADDDTADADADAPTAATPAAAAAPAAPRRPWPAGLPEQIKAVADVVATAARPLAQADIEARFTARGRWRDRLPVILETLEALGRARRGDDGSWRAQ